MKTQNETIVETALNAWQLQINRATTLFNSLTAAQLKKHIAPNRNTGIYLLGHLIAVHDAMFPTLGIGETLHPELEKPFIRTPDGSSLDKPTIKQLRAYWKEVHQLLTTKLATIPLGEWLNKHNNISDEDFQRDPHRNKLNILLVRTSHVAYHLGQLNFLREQHAVS